MSANDPKRTLRKIIRDARRGGPINALAGAVSCAVCDINSAMVKVIYDGDCPVCSDYVKRARLRPEADGLELIDARQAPGEVARLRAADISLDDGLVVEVGGARYHGAEALYRLALMSSASAAFNRMFFWWFRSRRRSRWSYPFLRGGRNLLLRLLGRRPIG